MYGVDYLKDATRLNLGRSSKKIDPNQIVLHYTAGSTLESAVSALRRKGNSYHILIDTDGKIYQGRSFFEGAGHAGRSNWKPKSDEYLENASSVNNRSIGISLVNLGLFGYWRNGYYHHHRTNDLPKIADRDANLHFSKYRPGRPYHYCSFTPEQLIKTEYVLAYLSTNFPSINELVTHEDVAIGGRNDCGPCAPVDEWRKKFSLEGGLGFQTSVQTNGSHLHVRDQPNMEGRVIARLTDRAKIWIRAICYTYSKNHAIIPVGNKRNLARWASVDIEGNNTHSGFVHMRYLEKLPIHPTYSQALQTK